MLLVSSRTSHKINMLHADQVLFTDFDTWILFASLKFLMLQQIPFPFKMNEQHALHISSSMFMYYCRN